MNKAKPGSFKILIKFINPGENIHNLELGKVSLSITPKALSVRAKN